MKFRAQVGREALAVLLGATHALGRVSDSNTATVVMSEDYFRFSVLSTQDVNHPRCFAELAVDALFLDYRIESQSANTIIFQISLSLLAKALMSGKQAQSSTLKLVKRDQQPCLSFESNAHASLASVDICHDIPIKLVHISELQWLSPPVVPPPKVALELPLGKSLKTMVDKFVRFSHTLVVHAQQSGRLGLRLDEVGAGVSIRCLINHLRPLSLGPAIGEGAPGTVPAHDGEQNSASVRVIVRHLAMAFDLQAMPASQALLFLASSTDPVVVHVKLQPEAVGAMTFYLPALPQENFDDEGDSHSDASAEVGGGGATMSPEF